MIARIFFMLGIFFVGLRSLEKKQIEEFVIEEARPFSTIT